MKYTSFESLLSHSQQWAIESEMKEKARHERAIASTERSLEIEARELLTDFQFKYPIFDFLQWKISVKADFNDKRKAYEGSYWIRSSLCQSFVLVDLAYENYNSTKHFGIRVMINFEKLKSLDESSDLKVSEAFLKSVDQTKQAYSAGTYCIKTNDFSLEKDLAVAFCKEVTRAVAYINDEILDKESHLDIYSGQFQEKTPSEVGALVSQWRDLPTSFVLEETEGFERYRGQLFRYRMENMKEVVPSNKSNDAENSFSSQQSQALEERRLALEQKIETAKRSAKRVLNSQFRNALGDRYNDDIQSDHDLIIDYIFSGIEASIELRQIKGMEEKA